MDSLVQYLWLLPVGLVVGAFGTLIGAGGGFLLVPLLIIAYPAARPETITSISLAVVFFNALSGSYAYARMKRIDFHSGLIFSAAAVPGAILGAYSTAFIPRRAFDLTFAVIMLAVAAYLLVRPRGPLAAGDTIPGGAFKRLLVDANGAHHSYSYSLPKGILLSFVVGLVSSLLGTGGGIIHVPAMAHLLNFPIHVATATSHFVLAVTSLVATIVHVLRGSFTEGVRRTLLLAVGVLIGAQLGARLSTRIAGEWIVRGLAVALALVGIRILANAL